MALDVLEGFFARLLIKLILDRVMLERLVGRSLKVVCEWLKWRLQVVAVLDLPSRVLVNVIVMVREKEGHVAVVLVQGILRVPGLQDEARLNAHELLADGLVRFGQDGVPLLIADESICGELHSVELFSIESVNDLSIGQVGPEHQHHRQENAMLR